MRKAIYGGGVTHIHLPILLLQLAWIIGHSRNSSTPQLPPLGHLPFQQIHARAIFRLGPCSVPVRLQSKRAKTQLRIWDFRELNAAWDLGFHELAEDFAPSPPLQCGTHLSGDRPLSGLDGIFGPGTFHENSSTKSGAGATRSSLILWGVPGPLVSYEQNVPNCSPRHELSHHRARQDNTPRNSFGFLLLLLVALGAASADSPQFPSAASHLRDALHGLAGLGLALGSARGAESLFRLLVLAAISVDIRHYALGHWVCVQGPMYEWVMVQGRG